MLKRTYPLIVILSFAVAAAAQFGRGPAGPQVTQTPPALSFHYLGPQPSGRISAAAGVAGDPNVYYLGAASGGVWKSTDGGHNFVPVFDHEDAQAIGALAVAPSDPNTVWAGTGEAWAIRDADQMGDGIYKSTDAGATWEHMGLEKTGRIGRIVIDPQDVNTVYACALGTTTGPQQDRGVFKTTDGGQNWKRVLFVNEWTGCSGLDMDPHDPQTLIAGTWQVLMHTWGEFSGTWPGYKGEPGSGVYISHDAGATWTHVTVASGMPKPPVGKIDVAIAPSDSKRMYALIQTEGQGSLWRSDDGGATWKDVNWNRTLIGRAGYYIRIAVNPFNEDDVLVTNSSFHRSYDGGKTFDARQTGGGYGGGAGARGARQTEARCGDCHDIWMDPKIQGRYVLTDDGGASIATGTAVLAVRLPNGQMYHVATDNQVPYWVYTNRQDNGTMRGPSNGPEGTGNGVVPGVAQNPQQAGRGGRGAGGFGGRGAPAAWQYALGGCESGFTLPEPNNPDIIWASCYGDEVTRYDAREKVAWSVSPWMHTLDSPPNQIQYRCHWTPPMAMDPFDGSVYYGCQVIFHTSDGGQTWQVISPDLSTHNPAQIVSSGGLVGDNLGQFYGDVVFAIAPSPIQRHLLWAGTNDGQLWYTNDGGGHWVNVTKNITGLPAGGTVTEISPSSFDPATAYVAFDLHLDNDALPYLFKTSDFGKTWTKISGGLPSGNPLDFARSVSENPNKRGMLFAGTGHGFFYSMNDGQSWTKFMSGLPPTEVSWITVQKREHDVVVSTYGRGIYVLPDITELEQTGTTAAAASDDTRLYAPRAGIRQARSGHAEFDFSLASAPSGPIKIAISDAQGQLLRTFEVRAHAGLNRATWDLRYDPPVDVALRTVAPDNPHIWDESRFQGKDTRPVIHWGIEEAAHVGPLAAPGAYRVRFIADGQTLTAPFRVVKDPAIQASDADLATSTAMQLRIRNDMSASATMINQLEVVRHQIEVKLAADPDAADTAALKAMGAKLMDAELQLLSRSSMESDDKYYPEKYKVYMNLVWFNGEVGTGAGDVAGGADHRPTAVEATILDGIEKQLATAKVGYHEVMNVELPAFNKANQSLALAAPANP